MELLGWFDLDAAAAPIGPAGGQSMPLVQQVLLYLVVLAGVVLSESVAMAGRGGPIQIDLRRPWLAVACIIALVVFPAVWRQIGALPDSSLLVQLGVAAQGGVFWGVVLAGAEKRRGSWPATGSGVAAGGELRLAGIASGMDADQHDRGQREGGDTQRDRHPRSKLEHARSGEAIDDERSGDEEADRP